MESNLTNFINFSTDIVPTEVTNVDVSKAKETFKPTCSKDKACNDPACTDTHSKGRNLMASTACRNGVECSGWVTGKDGKKHLCNFLHAKGWKCPLGSRCARNDCPGHSEQKCRYGMKCKNGKCPLGKDAHPDGWDHHANVECKFGFGCTKKTTDTKIGTCLFKHTPLKVPNQSDPAKVTKQGDAANVTTGPKPGSWAAKVVNNAPNTSKTTKKVVVEKVVDEKVVDQKEVVDEKVGTSLTISS